MKGELDRQDQTESRKVFAVTALALVAICVALWIVVPEAVGVIATALEPGLGLRTASLISLVLSICVLLLFTVAAGDGAISELPFVLIGFFFFWVMFTLMLAWIF